MRKQILAGLIATVALLFSVIALSTAPASSTDYSSYASTKGATATCSVNGTAVTGTVEGVPAGTSVVMTASNGTVVTTTTAADGSFALIVPAGATGMVTITAGGDVVANCGSGTTGGGISVAIVDPVPCGGPVSGSVSGGTAPYTVSVTFANGKSYSATLAAAGGYAFAISAADVPAGATTYNYSVTDAAGSTASGSQAATISYSCTTPNPTPGVVVPAVDFGFTNGIPTMPAPLAVTGSGTDILGFIATGLIALGAVAMGSRRKFLQGALED